MAARSSLQAINWPRLQEMAAWHGLLPLLSKYLESFAPGEIPGQVQRAMREQSRQAGLRNLLLASELLGISHHLNSKGIEHLAYKGPVLASQLFGTLGLRVSGDIDLLVPESQRLQAREALEGFGFVDANQFSESQLAAVFHYGFEHSFRRRGVEVDLHWRPVSRFASPSLDEKGIWQRAIAVPFSGQNIRTFSPEDLLVALCLHAAGHEWAILSNFCDIGLLLNANPAMRWEIVRRHLADTNTRRMFLVSMCLVSRHWSPLIPHDLAAEIAADREVANIANKIENGVWPESGLGLVFQKPLRWAWERTRGEAARDRLRYIAGVTIGPTIIDFETFKLPRPLIPLYPVLRGARLGLKYFRGAGQQSA
ncbi:MAG TPA: nucleotidyltransferase family protein [Terriglobales bacterium]|nr:nucleotidyltransferase family protein [Terriglobales bacterium]